ncbi:MAG: SGNH/GDSL hydrolase family protein [Burkholderiales bacterium]|nr:SGNH/GDSL hydrolase family protein [Burkholderiales bacterium]
MNKLSRRGFLRLGGAALASLGIPIIARATSLPSGNTYGVSASALPRWVAARQRVLSGQGIARVLCIGDSTTYGSGGPDMTGDADEYLYCYPTQLANMLSYLGIPANANGFAWGPPSGAAVRALTDPRVSADAGWGFYTADPTLGGYLARSVTPGATLSYTPDNACDTWRMWTVQNVGHGTIKAIVGGSSQAINTSVGPAQYTSFDIHAAGPTLRLSNAGSAPIYIAAIESWNSQSPSVVITNAGWPGSRLGDWAGVNSQASANNPLTAALAFKPDLYIIDAGINDWYKGTPVSTFTSQLNAFLTALHGVADVILVSGVPSNPGASGTSSQANQQAFVTAMKNAAAMHGIPFVDNWTRWGAWYNNRQMYSQNPIATDLHPGAAGYLHYAQPIAQVLAGV